MREPLIHIGYHKTGSTWLQRRVFSDTDRFLQVEPRTVVDEAFVVGNPFTFDPADAARTFEGLLTEAEARGLVPVISHERLSGKQGTGGLDSRAIADRIFASFPNARILVVIREQTSMMLSAYRAHLMRFGNKRVDQMWPQRTIRQRRSPGPSLEYYEYHHLIRYYQGLFGRDRVLVLPYELLVRDAAEFTGAICGFVGVDPPEEIAASRVNPGQEPIFLAILRYVNVVMRAVGFKRLFRGPIGDRRIRRARLRVLKFVGRYFPSFLSKPIERRWRETLVRLRGDRFERSNEITAAITGLNLRSFGYDMPTEAVAVADVTKDAS